MKKKQGAPVNHEPHRGGPPPARHGQKETPGQRSKAGDTLRQGAATPRGASCIGDRALSAWLPARLGRS